MGSWNGTFVMRAGTLASQTVKVSRGFSRKTMVTLKPTRNLDSRRSKILARTSLTFSPVLLWKGPKP